MRCAPGARRPSRSAGGGSGRTAPPPPRAGGVVLAVAEDRARIEEIIAGDPFVGAGVCAYRVTEFVATKTAPALERYRETLAR
ncbi:YciI family protein [Streptomyces sp. NPDC054808]